MHPGAWFTWVVAAGTVAATTTNPFYLVPLIAVTYLVYSVHHRSGPQARSFRFFVGFALVAFATRTLFIVFTPGGPTWDGLVYDALEGARLGVMLIIFGTFNAVTDPFRVLRLAPRRFQEPALAAALALSLTPRTIESAGLVREAQRLRGIDTRRWRSWVALVVPVLETGMEQAVSLAESMDARGHGRGRRTRYRPDRWRAGALVVAVAGAAAATLFLMGFFRHSASLVMPTYPARWPEVDILLLVSLILLAAPALFAPEER